VSGSLSGGRHLGRIARKVLADDVQAELAQDRAGGLAVEEEFERGPDELAGDHAPHPRLAAKPAGTLTSWLVPAGVWTRKLPPACWVTVICVMEICSALNPDATVAHWTRWGIIRNLRRNPATATIEH
jgi:hypothetical protein